MQPEKKTEALRYNTGKFRMSLVPSSLTLYTAAGMTYGEQKYAAHNWRKGFNWSSILDSLQRHIDAFKEGENIDDESGLPHLCLIACNVGFLTEHFHRGLGKDDRYKHPEGQDQWVLAFKTPPKPPEVKA